jgi:5-formyltetrahydrofolate cyclo-ligase
MDARDHLRERRPAREEQPARIIECSSPPCMLQEFEAEASSTGLPAINAAQDWDEVRLWRRAKRAVLIERRVAMSATERAGRNEAITAALMQALAPPVGMLIGFYWPFKGEYDPRPLARSLHGKGVRLALPVVAEKAKPLVFRAWWPGIPMMRGVWNIPVPASGDPVAPDVLLVPLVGFDPQRYRLGYGGGYYDRTLAASSPRPRVIGVGFELSRIATIHPQPHDIAMDLIITEGRAA